MALAFTYRLDSGDAPRQLRGDVPVAVGAPIPALDQAFTGSMAGSTWALEEVSAPAAPIPELDQGSMAASETPLFSSGLGFSCLELLTAFSEGMP